jgi:hypothetical protein
MLVLIDLASLPCWSSSVTDALEGYREPCGALVLSRPWISGTASVAGGRMAGTDERDSHDVSARPCLQDCGEMD